jgi:two-component system, LytTR family, sensor kinase
MAKNLTAASSEVKPGLHGSPGLPHSAQSGIQQMIGLGCDMQPSRKTMQRWLFLAFVAGYFTAIGLLHFGYKYLDDLSRQETATFLPRLIEEMTGAYSAAILFPFILIFARRFRLQRHTWLKRLPAHLLAMIAFSAAHTSLMAISRNTIFPIAGLGAYDYGIMSIRYFMEFSNDVISYWLAVALIYLFDYYRESRDREVRTAQLETRLAQAQLQALRLQLQPHFLFNALNTISSMIYESPRAADQMITRLSDLLRLMLGQTESQEVTLQEEISLLDLYLGIMRARFEERLVVRFDVEPEARRALVPQLILQPLVENSIRHGGDPESGAVTIDVAARREGHSLLLEVRDGGPGLAKKMEAANGNGIGLANTARRLDHLYGPSHGFELEARAGGGLTVKVKVPFRVSLSASVESEGAKDSHTDSR